MLRRSLFNYWKGSVGVSSAQIPAFLAVAVIKGMGRQTAEIMLMNTPEYATFHLTEITHTPFCLAIVRRTIGNVCANSTYTDASALP